MTMSTLSGSNGASAAAPYVLPTRLEQLVGDCFDEEQCELKRIQGEQHLRGPDHPLARPRTDATGLATLSSLVGPNVFPSQ